MATTKEWKQEINFSALNFINSQSLEKKIFVGAKRNFQVTVIRVQKNTSIIFTSPTFQ